MKRIRSAMTIRPKPTGTRVVAARTRDAVEKLSVRPVGVHGEGVQATRPTEGTFGQRYCDDLQHQRGPAMASRQSG
jgi:hypothetical protein